jgi:hypothetical protein
MSMSSFDHNLELARSRESIETEAVAVLEVERRLAVFRV